MPKDERIIRGDLDRVYDDPKATCHLICSYILSKGDLKTNKVSNKFCNIEILKGNGLFYLAITSGRLGAKDNNIIVRRFNSDTIVRKLYLEECKKREQEGYSKVEVVSIYPNCSEAAKQFVSQKNVISKEDAKEIKEKSTAKLKEPIVVTKQSDFEIDPKVAKFVKNVYFEANQTIKKSLNPSAFQRNDTPLGMINLNMINKGRDILAEVATLQNKLVKAKRNREMLMENIAVLSNMYNSTIPRVLKRGSDSWLLDTGEKLMEQFELLDVLELALSSAVLNTNMEVDIESQYNGLNSDITLVTDKNIINDIKEKMKREQLHNHHFNTKLCNVFEINQKNAPAFDSSCGNVTSLFHGTRAANLYGILSTHIKLPRNLGSNVQLTGAMFGPGCYFGEYSKSLQYATARFGGTQNKSKKYYLFICDVALGKMKMEPHAKNYAQSPAGYNSVMGVGDDAFRDGCNIKGIGGNKDLVIPKSAFMKTLGSSRSSLLHNEFIVYNQNRFRIRYIIEVEAA